MQALTIIPGRPGSLQLTEVAEPAPRQGSVLVRTLAIGICGSDRELIDGQYGEPPEGEERLVLGHESLGRVLEASPQSGFAVGDTVVGIVRHPDPVPCVNCARGEWDMCRNGLYTERGIKQAHGFASERFRSSPEFLVLENRVVFGSVNANRRHYEAATQALARAERAWLERLITSRHADWEQAYRRRKSDVKTVLIVEN